MRFNYQMGMNGGMNGGAGIDQMVPAVQNLLGPGAMVDDEEERRRRMLEMQGMKSNPLMQLLGMGQQQRPGMMTRPGGERPGMGGGLSALMQLLGGMRR